MPANKTPSELNAQVKQLDPSPYGTLIERAEVQQWRNAFGALQFRVRDLQKVVLEMTRACELMLARIENVEERLNTPPENEFVEERVSEDDTDN